MAVLNHFDLFGLIIKVCKLQFKVLKLWVLGLELLKAIFRSLFPEPLVNLETVKELRDFVLCSLYGTSEKQNDLDNLLVFSNPVVEGFALVFGQVTLIPVLNFFRRLEYMRSGTIDGRLDFFQRRLKDGFRSFKLDINFEKRLQNLFGCVASAADALFHLIE